MGAAASAEQADAIGAAPGGMAATHASRKGGNARASAKVQPVWDEGEDDAIERKARQLEQLKDRVNAAIASGSRVKQLLEDEVRRDLGLSAIRLRFTANGALEHCSLFSEPGGRHGCNQDSMIAWEDFNVPEIAGRVKGRMPPDAASDVIFCAVFDGHGPNGHLVSQRVRDSLPSRIASLLAPPPVATVSPYGHLDKSAPPMAPASDQLLQRLGVNGGSSKSKGSSGKVHALGVAPGYGGGGGGGSGGFGMTLQRSRSANSLESPRLGVRSHVSCTFRPNRQNAARHLIAQARSLWAARHQSSGLTIAQQSSFSSQSSPLQASSRALPCRTPPPLFHTFSGPLSSTPYSGPLSSIPHSAPLSSFHSSGPPSPHQACLEILGKPPGKAPGNPPVTISICSADGQLLTPDARVMAPPCALGLLLRCLIAWVVEWLAPGTACMGAASREDLGSETSSSCNGGNSNGCTSTRVADRYVSLESGAAVEAGDGAEGGVESYRGSKWGGMWEEQVGEQQCRVWCCYAVCSGTAGFGHGVAQVLAHRAMTLMACPVPTPLLLLSFPSSVLNLSTCCCTIQINLLVILLVEWLRHMNK
ncbi:unnamed protein product [Closterium sp. NIES-64]|nr:unnamed protein product [Closterium sp. NIES-64]